MTSIQRTFFYFWSYCHKSLDFVLLHLQLAFSNALPKSLSAQNFCEFFLLSSFCSFQIVFSLLSIILFQRRTIIIALYMHAYIAWIDDLIKSWVKFTAVESNFLPRGTWVPSNSASANSASVSFSRQPPIMLSPPIAMYLHLCRTCIFHQRTQFAHIVDMPSMYACSITLINKKYDLAT